MPYVTRDGMSPVEYLLHEKKMLEERINQLELRNANLKDAITQLQNLSDVHTARIDYLISRHRNEC